MQLKWRGNRISKFTNSNPDPLLTDQPPKEYLCSYSDAQAQIGLKFLDKIKKTDAKRITNVNILIDNLSDQVKSRMPVVPENTENTFWRLPINVENPEELKKYLFENQIDNASTNLRLVSEEPVFKQYHQDTPEARKAHRAPFIPIHSSFKKKDMLYISYVLNEYFNSPNNYPQKQEDVSGTTDIVFTRPLLTAEEMYNEFALAGAEEPSLGLCYLAAVTRENGYNTEIVDAIALKLRNKELAELIVSKKPKFVGISAVTISIYNASDLAKRIKELDENITVIIGGVHITAVPEETMRRFSHFDIGVLGEAEITIVELLDALKNNQELDDIPGLILRKGDGFEITAKRLFIRDLDSLPMPAWNLLPDMKTHYAPPAWSMNRDTSTLLITSRGCSNTCTYCDRGGLGPFVRAHSADYVMKMIEHLYQNYGIKQFRINDDNFILFKPRLKEMCRQIIDKKLPITWSCFGRASNADPETLKIMRDAGCWQISYGVETGSQEIQDLEDKNLTLDQIEKAIRLTKEAGIQTIGFTMIGHPKETVETIKATIKFCKKLALDDFKMVYLTPYPSTPIYKEASKYGTLNDDWNKMNCYLAPCFVPYGLTKEEIIKYRKRAYREFYLRPKIIFSHLSQIRSFHQVMVLAKGGTALLKLWLGKTKSKNTQNLNA